jgi:CRP-like cAMP-binding protein
MVLPASNALRGSVSNQSNSNPKANTFIDFLKKYPVKSFEKGSIILHQGEVPTCVYVVRQGIVKSYTISYSGDEKPINFCLNSDIMATAWVFKKSPATIFFYEAYTDCEVYCIPRSEFTDFVKSNIEAMQQLLDRYVTKYVAKTLRINALEYSRAIDKIAHTLQYMCLNYGRERRAGVIEIDMPLAQQELANLTGLTRETTGLELKKLQSRGIISYVKRRYVVHMDELKSVIGEDELGELKLR